jgi:hypothetical protein
VPSSTTPRAISHIDKERLRRIYETHRSSFWNTIASEYGEGVSPTLLEETFIRGGFNAPPTPCISPDTHVSAQAGRLAPSPFPAFSNKIAADQARAEKGFSPINGVPLPTPNTATPSSASSGAPTAISALLGVNAEPRSPKDRELIKKLEERDAMAIDTSHSH